MALCTNSSMKPNSVLPNRGSCHIYSSAKHASISSPWEFHWMVVGWQWWPNLMINILNNFLYVTKFSIKRKDLLTQCKLNSNLVMSSNDLTIRRLDTYILPCNMWKVLWLQLLRISSCSSLGFFWITFIGPESDH